MDSPAPLTPNVIAEHGLSADEYKLILSILGRAPNLTELGIFSVMWSEHCSYKSSKVWLKKLPTQAPPVIQGPGENGGDIDIHAFLAPGSTELSSSSPRVRVTASAATNS